MRETRDTDAVYQRKSATSTFALFHRRLSLSAHFVALHLIICSKLFVLNYG